MYGYNETPLSDLKARVGVEYLIERYPIAASVAAQERWSIEITTDQNVWVMCPGSA